MKQTGIIRDLRRELVELKLRCVNNHASADRIIAWLQDDNRKPAMTAFTEGPERQIAYEVERLLWRVFKS